MNRLGRIAMLSAIVFMAVACGSEKGKIIPRSRFAQLYASLFEADAWLEYHSVSRFTADSTNFYLPILKSYGYSDEDYRRSVYHYLKDPGRFSKILEESKEILQKQVDEIQAIVDHDNRIEDYIRTGKRVVRKPVMFDTLIAHAGFTDKVDISMDEFGRYCFNKVMEDTSFYGPRLIIAEKDTAAAYPDSLCLPPRPRRLESIDQWNEAIKEILKKRESSQDKETEPQEPSPKKEVETSPPPPPRTRPLTVRTKDRMEEAQL